MAAGLRPQLWRGSGKGLMLGCLAALQGRRTRHPCSVQLRFRQWPANRGHGSVAEQKQLLCKPRHADLGPDRQGSTAQISACVFACNPCSLSVLGAGQGLQIVGLAALLIRLSLWLGLLSHRRRLSSDNCEDTTLPIEARASRMQGAFLSDLAVGIDLSSCSTVRCGHSSGAQIHASGAVLCHAQRVASKSEQYPHDTLCDISGHACRCCWQSAPTTGRQRWAAAPSSCWRMRACPTAAQTRPAC